MTAIVHMQCSLAQIYIRLQLQVENLPQPEMGAVCLLQGIAIKND